MGLYLITPPAAEPVSLVDAKAWLRVSFTNDDTLISSLITAARFYAENYLNRQLVTATWELRNDIFPIYSYLQFPFPYYQVQNAAYGYGYNWSNYLQNPNLGILDIPNYKRERLPNWGNIVFPRPPLQSVTSIKYLDPDGTLQTWAGTNYQTVTGIEPGYVKPLVALPAVKDNTPEAVRYQYTCGYGAAADVPAPITVAIKLLVGAWYDNRQPTELGKALDQAVHALLDQYRFWGFN